MKTLIVDYGLCNLDSVVRAIEQCGGHPILTDDPRDLENAARIILPGVGSYFEAMRRIRALGWDEALREAVQAQGKAMLGICLGMQLLASFGEEGGGTEGLGLVDGQVIRLPDDDAETRIPHIGWNEVHRRRESPLFMDLPDKKDFYFVHSYHFVPTLQESILAMTPYCGGFASVVTGPNVYGVQFHPEKSLKIGLALVRNFLTYC